MKEAKTLQLIRRLLAGFMIILFLSGLTAIPVEYELSLLLKIFPSPNQIHDWLDKVLSAHKKLNHDTPFLLYGYDWLAFAHFILTILFIGPYRDPVKNIWVIEFGLIACVLIFPLAFIAGPFRGNSYWLEIDRLLLWRIWIIAFMDMLFKNKRTNC